MYNPTYTTFVHVYSRSFIYSASTEGTCSNTADAVVLLTCTSIANDHDRVPNLDQLLQLHHLQDKVVLSLKTKVL